MSRPTLRSTVGAAFSTVQTSLQTVDSLAQRLKSIADNTQSAVNSYGYYLQSWESKAEALAENSRDEEIRQLYKANMRARMLAELQREAAEL